MKIQDMVCTLEQAKELKELGIEQVGVFSWAYDITNEQWDISHRSVESLLLTKDSNSQMAAAVVGYYSAFTTDELLAMLPDVILGFEFQISKIGNSYYCEYVYHSDDGDRLMCHGAHHPAESLAITLIHCLKQNYFTADEANKRLQS